MLTTISFIALSVTNIVSILLLEKTLKITRKVLTFSKSLVSDYREMEKRLEAACDSINSRDSYILGCLDRLRSAGVPYTEGDLLWERDRENIKKRISASEARIRGRFGAIIDEIGRNLIGDEEPPELEG